ncbi:rho GTPase-activating protein 24 [Erpetoichthys calabaricus]|uniref:rho GTPase-activating protein 24 n=1 Tax=Erpetoichthys calabaricus TaxID=27687 RepID=UPI0022341439|nr:rho GTPase-activating protein 24 [Erpetoichthys calabaricus]
MGLNCIKPWKCSTYQDVNKDIPVSPGSYYFMTSGSGQNEWKTPLEAGPWLPFTGVFGQKLEDTVMYERRYGERAAPLIVEQCVTFIESNGLHEGGLFRRPGQAELIKELRDAFDAGEKPTFDRNTDVHTVASLLKLYFRELPEPVVPFSKYEDFVLSAKLLTWEREQGMAELKRNLEDLPKANLNLLRYICRFLNEVHSYSNVNKMDSQNLAAVFGTNILRPKGEDPEAITGGAALAQQLMALLICEHSRLFLQDPAGGVVNLPGGQSGAKRKKKKEEEEEEKEEESKRTTSSFHSSSYQAYSLDDGPLLIRRSYIRQLSLPLLGRKGFSRNLTQEDRSASSQSHLVPAECRYQSSMEKGTSEGPSKWKVCGRGAASESALQCSSSARVIDMTNEAITAAPVATAKSKPQNKCAPGVTNPQGGQAPEDNQSDDELSTNAHESSLSVYDNLCGGTPASKPEDLTSVESISWSPSSCEMPPADSTHSSRRSSRTTSVFEESGDRASGRPNNVTNMEVAGDKSGNSGAASNTHDSSSGTHPAARYCLFTGLKQELVRQKVEYERKIKSLEQRNEALEAEVTELQLNLEQQKKWFNILEIKMRNVERAKADAEKRNTVLQQEMENFFDTFGELTGDVKKTERTPQRF